MTEKIVRTNDNVWVLNPKEPMLGPVADGGTITAHTSPGCWGPMITPEGPSGHEVTRPIAVASAEVGDAVALRIRKVNILSTATVSGTEQAVEGYFVGDPYVAARCPVCDIINPPTRLEGTGKDCIRCKKCGNPVTPFHLKSGYTMVFDQEKTTAITVSSEACKTIANRAVEFAALPPEAMQYPINLWAKADLPGIITRVRPMIGNVGSCPAVPIPSSHNAGDFGAFLVGAPHKYGLTAEELLNRTDGHMDSNEVCEGAILIVPVKVPGAGIYIGDVHAMMGDGEIAGHTTDVSAEVTLDVEVVKGLKLDGPILLPNREDLPFLAQPYDSTLLAAARKLASQYQTQLEEDVFPLQVIGSGPTLDAAVANGLTRMSELIGLSMDEVKNRATIVGSIMISRLPGVVQVTAMIPRSKLEALGIIHLFEEQYGSAK